MFIPLTHTNANDYIRLEHDQTDANIFSGNGGINLVPLSGAVGISGGGLNVGTNGITFGDDTTQKGATKDVGTFTISASSGISTGAKQTLFIVFHTMQRSPNLN